MWVPPAGYDESYHVFCHRRRLKVEMRFASPPHGRHQVFNKLPAVRPSGSLQVHALPQLVRGRNLDTRNQRT